MTGIKNSRRILLVMIVVAPGLALGAALVNGGGNVLPPKAKPRGYSLTDMATAIAQFSTSGNNSEYYPDTPFQILAEDTSTIVVTPVTGGVVVTGSNSFTVASGTQFFVPVYYADDSPPFTPPFPADAREAAPYIFNVNGVKDLEIVVDGESTCLGADYVAGPVQTTPLQDGGGTHFISVGAFLTPLSMGKHTVAIKGKIVSGGSFEKVTFTYKVQVVREH